MSMLAPTLDVLVTKAEINRIKFKTYRKAVVSHSVSGPVGRGTLVFVKIWVPSPTP